MLAATAAESPRSAQGVSRIQAQAEAQAELVETEALVDGRRLAVAVRRGYIYVA
jgi:hypothetical protein